MASRALHLVHRVPYPPDKGDRIRSFNTLRFLSQHCEIYLATLADEPVSEETKSALSDLCADVAIVPISKLGRWPKALWSMLRGRSITAGAFHSSKLSQIIRDWQQKIGFDVCLASASSMVPYLKHPTMKHVPAVVDLVDVDSQKWLDYGEASRGPKRWLYRIEGKQLRRLETDIPKWARGVLLTTPREVELYEGYAGEGSAIAIENGVDLEFFEPVPDSEEQSCVFVGAMDYRPNVDGIIWFCENVWPDLRKQAPSARLTIVGRNPTPAVQTLDQLDGVHVAGTVPDVRPYVSDAGLVVVPLHIARGVQNKVLEALAMSKAVVASPTCLGGLATKIGHDLIAATEPKEWVDQITHLWGDKKRRVELGQNGRQYVEEHHSWESCLRPLLDLMFPTP